MDRDTFFEVEGFDAGFVEWGGADNEIRERA